ncbi:amastin [Trypanosoma cruzi]|uniref:Putative amastin n=1 Tax=Trypanosoma cruzi TaxID=5693 RepID=A0A2V2V548_TRYCR|nr:putative amastin [Trypanosoma cruzi]PBJ80706.1 amastin [Trypanosoma cruzi cruzi]PWU91677.1 putative amastin [Trypanosoma cruzi]RNF24951.1 amastin [Trypanosoma cruzi]
MSKKKNFFVREYGKHKGATGLLLACMVSFIFFVIGTPIAMLQPKLSPGTCYTLWGTRACNSPNYDWRVNWDTCKARRLRFQFGEAFSICALYFAVVAGIGSWYVLSGSKKKWLTVIASAISTVSGLVTWSMIASIHNVKLCGSDTYTSANTKYGPGFALFVTGFAVQFCGLLGLIVLE